MAETEAGIRAFFEGQTIQVGDRTIHCPGWYDVLNQPCDLRDPNNIKLYKDLLARMASLNEALVAGASTEYGVVPEGARRASTQSTKPSANTTAIEGLTFPL